LHALRLFRVGMGTRALLVGLIFAGSLLSAEPQGSNPKTNKANSNLPAEVAESSSDSTSKAKPTKGSKKSAPPAAPADMDAERDVYRIGIEDELTISVWREPELTSSVVVRPDGNITLPLLNDIPVVGLRTEELQNLLTEKLKAFVNEPQVTIIVRQIRSRKVYLFGQVSRPGTFTLNGRKTVLELLGEGGGLGPFAKSESIYILRRRGDQQVRIPFHYKSILAGRSDNVVLLPGDMVVVP